MGGLDAPGVAATVAGVNDRPTVVTVVIPFLNSLQHLRRTAPGVVEAAGQLPGVEVIYVDNGSSDGSTEFLQTIAAAHVRVLQRPKATIAAMRNWGAAQGSGPYISFLDADCGVNPDYFHIAVATMEESRADATGCEYALPDDPHWVEKALYDLHYMGRDRDVVYINAGNFFIRRSAFESVSGFREDLRTDEDSDIGRRLTEAGFRIREAPVVHAVHYGNPKSLVQHYRRTVWHSLGMFDSTGGFRLDKPTTMLLVHLLATVAGIAILLGGPWGFPARIAAAVGLQAVAPAITVAFRIRQTGRIPSPLPALLVYWVYYWARAEALFRILSGRGVGYRK